MKLTPWMLTVATFCMVAVITVSYFFKNSTAVVQPAPRLASQPGWILPPASIGTSMSPVNSTAAVPIEPTVSTDETTPFSEQSSETYIPESSANTIEPNDIGQVLIPEPVLSTSSIDDEPIDPLFGDSTEFSDTTSYPDETNPLPNEPTNSGFVTQQFRSTERTDVRFVNGEAVPERVAQDASKSIN